jgi:hypothetical protein
MSRSNSALVVPPGSGAWPWTASAAASTIVNFVGYRKVSSFDLAACIRIRVLLYPLLLLLGGSEVACQKVAAG